MTDGLFFRKITGSLYPADDDAAEWLRRRRAASLVLIEPVQVRNVDRLKVYWVMCGIVAGMHPELTSKLAVDQAIKMRSGLVEVFSFTLPDGERVFMQRAGSIAIANMKEYEFEAYLNQVADIIARDLLPGVDVEELRKEAYLRAADSR